MYLVFCSTPPNQKRYMSRNSKRILRFFFTTNPGFGRMEGDRWVWVPDFAEAYVVAKCLAESASIEGAAT